MGLRELSRRLAVIVLATTSCRNEQSWDSVAGSTGLVTTTGGELFYRVAGAGPDTVVAVHGGPGLHMNYLAPAVVPLAKQITWILYDQRGRGRSGALVDSTAVGLEYDVADLEAIRSHFRIERLSLLGHNWGAAVAAHYSARHPERVSRLLLVSPYPISQAFIWGWHLLPRDTARFRRGAEATRTWTTAVGATKFCHDYWFWYFQPVYIPENIDEAAAARATCDISPDRLIAPDRYQLRWLKSSAAHDWGPAMRGVAAPTLVVEGIPPDTSHRLYRVHAERWAQEIPGARVALIDGASLLPWIANPTDFQEVALRFLTGEWPTTAYPPPVGVVGPGPQPASSREGRGRRSMKSASIRSHWKRSASSIRRKCPERSNR